VGTGVFCFRVTPTMPRGVVLMSIAADSTRLHVHHGAPLTGTAPALHPLHLPVPAPFLPTPRSLVRDRSRLVGVSTCVAGTMSLEWYHHDRH
jgi:hypothetical protein